MTPFYLVQSVCSQGESFFYETVIDKCDRKTTVKDLFDGQYDMFTLEKVIEIDLAAGTATDVSRAIADEISDLSFDRFEAPSESAQHLLGLHKISHYEPPARSERYDCYPFVSLR
jgi:hypothetical protein